MLGDADEDEDGRLTVSNESEIIFELDRALLLSGLDSSRDRPGLYR